MNDRVSFAMIVITILIISIIAGFGSYVLNYSNKHVEKVIVVDGERIVKQTANNHMSSHYVIFTKEPNTDKTKVFAVVDLLFYGKFNASDTYAKLIANKGHLCEIEVSGLRVPFLSHYPNVIKVLNCETLNHKEVKQ